MASVAIQTFPSPPSGLMAYSSEINQPEHEAHEVQAEVHYLKDADDGTHPAIGEIANMAPKFLETRRVTIKDVRGAEQAYTLEEHGFQFVHHTASMKDFGDEKMVESEHFPEVEAFVKKVTGASKVMAFNHIVRNAPRSQHDTPKGYKGPAGRPHVDVAPSYAPIMLREKFPEEADEIMPGRWQALNLWRPIKTVLRDPLAISDATTVPASDQYLFTSPAQAGKPPVQILFTRAGEESAHRWYYLKEQRPDELLIFKTFDSDEGARTRMVTHTSFVDPEAADMPTRESIEIRCIAVY